MTYNPHESLATVFIVYLKTLQRPEKATSIECIFFYFFFGHSKTLIYNM